MRSGIVPEAVWRTFFCMNAVAVLYIADMVQFSSISFVSVDSVLVDREVLHAEFHCDLGKCKGVCCVEGELGAPLSPLEARRLERLPEAVIRMLPEKNIRYLRRHGGVEVYRGEQYTRTISGRECVYAFVSDGVTLCAIETAYREGMVDFDKPLSCRLFPLRVDRKFGLEHLTYERRHICLAARELGRERQTRLLDYIEKALESVYGREWVATLKAFVGASREL